VELPNERILLPNERPTQPEVDARGRQAYGCAAKIKVEIGNSGSGHQEDTMRRSVVILVLLLGLPAALSAQTQHGSWSNLNGLRAGQGIEVIESSMKRHAGEFVTVTDELLTLKENGSDVSVKREDVGRVSTSSGPKRGEHALIGLVVGGAIGAGIGAASTGSGWRGVGALAGIVIGAPSGALVGTLPSAHTTVYRAAHAAASH
jgi:hypothetical protein